MYDGVGSFVAVDKYPEVKVVCDKLLDNFERLEKVARRLPYLDWPEKYLYGEGWTIASLRYKYQDYNPLFRFIVDPLIQSAGFSQLAGGTVIQPHRGYAGDVFRIHLGLSIPQGTEEQIGIRVGGLTRQWVQGGFLMFSDLDEHEAWNKTTEDRLILLLDIPKGEIKDIDPSDLRT